LETLVFEERRKPEYPEKKKPLGARTRTTNKRNRRLTPSLGIEPGPHWWEASALTTAPSLLSQFLHLAVFRLEHLFIFTCEGGHLAYLLKYIEGRQVVIRLDLN